MDVQITKQADPCTGITYTYTHYLYPTSTSPRPRNESVAYVSCHPFSDMNTHGKTFYSPSYALFVVGCVFKLSGRVGVVVEPLLRMTESLPRSLLPRNQGGSEMHRSHKDAVLKDRKPISGNGISALSSPAFTSKI